MAQWKYGLFGYFENFTVCILTMFVPCYTEGKLAETVGHNCALCGVLYGALLVCLCECWVGCVIRGDIRKSKGIDGSPVSDCCLHCWCGCCALIQEARETGALGSTNMAGDGAQVMERA